MTAAVLVLAAASPAAAGAAPRETAYDVTFEAQMVERWSFDEHADRDCAPEGRCVRDAKGSGTAKVLLRTPTPQRVSVTTGPRLQPMITYASNAGIPLKGYLRRGGTFTDTYGGAWDAANEDVVAPTSGCGNHPLRTEVSLGWKGRNKLAPILMVDDRLACPAGPPRGFDYATVPTVTDVVAQVGETKFGRLRQFRVGGTQTWPGTTPAINRTDPQDILTSHGQSEIRWTWEATFRKVVKKKRRRR